MRKSLLLSLPLLLGCVYANARQISPSEAMDFAADFMNSAELRTAGAKALTPMKAPGVNGDAQNSPYYVFNRGEGEGFVIISGDDRAPKILGYSDKGSFDAENLPPQLKAMMEQWGQQMESLPASAELHASWSKAPATRAGEGVLLETAEWGQGYPYNALCPVIEGEQAPTGCVATAMAIAMKYHNWPDYTRGNFQTDYYYPELGFDFSNYTIDWEVLNDNTNTKFAEEVSKLMFSAGVCNSMFYGPYESSSEVWPVGHKMIELYTYAKGAQFIVKDRYSDSEWDAILKKQLENVGPVIYRGDGSAAHCFIVDGFNPDGLYHLNWGWDGLLNGYYTLDFSEVGGNYFPQNHAMIVDLRPDYERKVYSRAFIPDIMEYDNQQWNFFAPDVIPGERIDVLFPTVTQNCHSGFYGMAVVDEDDNIKEIFYRTTPASGIRYSCSYPGIIMDVNSVVFPELKEGERYQLVSMDATFDPDSWSYTPSEPSYNPSDWKIVLGGVDYPSFFYENGNKSEISEVTLHINEEIPIFMEVNHMYPTSEPFTIKRLKSGDFCENFYIPKKGFSIDVYGRNNDGNADEILINSSDYDGTTNLYNINITMNQDYFDIFVNYKRDTDTRKDSGYSSDEIIDYQGIVYRIKGNEAIAIGYDNISESVLIPDEIETSYGALKVTSVESDAFLHAPVKHISFEKRSELNYLQINDLAFDGMENLESISIGDDASLFSFRYGYPFLKSQFNQLYLNACPYRWSFPNLLNIKQWVSEWDYWNQSKPFDAGTSDQHNVDVYIANPIENPELNFSSLTDLLDYITEINTIYQLDDLISGIYLPGIGASTALAKIEEYDVPVNQMWTYAIDRDHKAIRIQPQIDEIKILSVLVNGQTVESNENGIYAVPSTEEMTVTVNYILHDRQEMTTVYDAAYNNELPSQNLSADVPAESIQISQTEAKLKVGESLILTATVLPEEATDKTLAWTTDNETVANVDAEGNVMAIAVGSATITASCGEVSATCLVTVNPILVESIQLTPDKWNGEEGESFKIEATVLPEEATDKSLTWSSSDESIATVDAEGNVSVLKDGSCVITATASDGSGVVAECVITSAAGVEGIFSDADCLDIFDIKGVQLKKDADREALKTLTPGIYILRSGGEMKKVVIR